MAVYRIEFMEGAEADHFEAEVDALRDSRRFHSFLDGRFEDSSRVPIEEIEEEIEEGVPSSRRRRR